MFSCRLVRSLVIGRPVRGVTLMVCITLACVLSLAGPRAAAAQPSPASQPRSTVEGVYTAAQATRGADVYAGLCQSCHSAESHTGAPFRNNWVGKPLAELYAYISNEMPKSEPGSLSREEYTVVLAYILRMNGMPAGRRALSAEPAVLDSIRIELPPARSGGAERRP